MKFRARPRVLVPTDETVRLTDANGRTSDTTVHVMARIGIHASPASVDLLRAINREPRRVAELLVSVPEESARPSVAWRFLAEAAPMEVVTDQPVVRRRG